jgi:hypothetical protein
MLPASHSITHTKFKKVSQAGKMMYALWHPRKSLAIQRRLQITFEKNNQQRTQFICPALRRHVRLIFFGSEQKRL